MSEGSKVRELLEKLRARSKGAGFNDEKTGQRHYTPWAWRTPDSIYCGWDGSVWVYRALDLPPWTWADGSDKVRYGGRLSEVFGDLVGITPKSVLPTAMANVNREFHLVNVTWWEPATSPNTEQPALFDYQESALQGMTTPRRTLLLGVRLKPRAGGVQKERGAAGVAKAIQALTLQVLGEDTPELGVYAKDYQEVSAILRRAGGRLPTRTEQYQLESWYNFGRGPEARMIEEWDRILVEGFDQVQMVAVSDFHRPILRAPDATWILDALNHPSAPHVVSVRGRMTPPQQARAKARSAIRWSRDQAEQEARTGDVGRREVEDVHELASIFEDHFAETRYPLLSEVSVIFGRRIDRSAETFVEDLRNAYDIEVTPLLGRQLAALDETLPTSAKRVNPYPQELSTDMIAFSGINSFSELGDGEGALIGVTAEDGVPVYLDFLGAPKANQPATMAIFGDSGSGKTVLLQNIATQAALAGLPVMLINPKGLDSLAPFAELVGGQVVSMSRIEKEGGFFDPFRFTDPEAAADIAASFILSVFSQFTETQQIMLRDGLRRGALHGGAQCVMDALQYVEDEEVRAMVIKAAGAEPRIGLGIGTEPAEPFHMAQKLVLIEFDKGLDLPEPGGKAENMSQRAALAAMQHVVRVALEAMSGRTGGVLIVDEAWTFLEQNEARQALEGLGRKGRSMNVLPILATQKVADLLDYDMESLLSRVLCLSMRDPREAAAALTLAGLEPTEARIAFLQDCGPRRGADGRSRVPLAVHRDLRNRHGVILLGPIPRRALEAFSTNPEDRRRREEALREIDDHTSPEDAASTPSATSTQEGWTEGVIAESEQDLESAREIYQNVTEAEDRERLTRATEVPTRERPTDTDRPEPEEPAPPAPREGTGKSEPSGGGSGWQPGRRK